MDHDGQFPSSLTLEGVDPAGRAPSGPSREPDSWLFPRAYQELRRAEGADRHARYVV